MKMTIELNENEVIERSAGGHKIFRYPTAELACENYQKRLAGYTQQIIDGKGSVKITRK